ncbi:UNVERIFIED_CONTAM: hypothetical protein Slati_0170000 [Sesamum latifolium]|uniref:Uncharacterized protein n=1 Tax=Sesamum latifolium TaxID=2727402 RepID=A0AAW2YAT1_9LAMI
MKRRTVIDYINRWRNLSLDCKDRLLKLLQLRCAFKGCIGTSLYSPRNSTKSFEELATRAHDMELSIKTSGVEGPPIQELRKTKEKQEVKKGGKPISKAPNNISMIVNVALFKLKNTAKDNVSPKNNVPYEKPQRKLTLKKYKLDNIHFLTLMSPAYLITCWRLISSICQK